MTTKIKYTEAYDLGTGVLKGIKHAVLPVIASAAMFMQANCDPQAAVLPAVTLGVVLAFIQNAVQFQLNKK